LLSRREALKWLSAGGMALGLAACTPTPPRTEPKPAATSAPAAQPTEAPKPAAPAAPAPTEAPKPAAQPAAQPTTAPAAIKKGGTLIIGADVNPVGLDPHLTTAFASVAIYEHLYSSLLTMEYKTNKVKPDLAESWKQVDPNTVEFKLRQGVKFHSGRELTAEDVKYTWERLLDPKLTVPLKNYIGPGAEVQVVDKYTARLRNDPVYAPLLSCVADRRPTAIVDREVVEKNGDLKNWDGGRRTCRFSSGSSSGSSRTSRPASPPSGPAMST
jgi:ABC-type transport system substrate-binding protein